MRLRRRHRTGVSDDAVTDRVPGPSLARPPALIVGTILLAFGLGGFLVNADFPRNFPDGFAQGESWLGFEVNGWTNLFTAAAGGLLLFGAATHLLAKAMSLIVGLALATCAVMAAIDRSDVLGLAAANFWTKLGWAVAAVVLLATAAMPRAARRHAAAATGGDHDTRADAGADAPTTTMPRTGRFRRGRIAGRPAAEPAEREHEHV
jgi:hypothetical protein